MWQCGTLVNGIKGVLLAQRERREGKGEREEQFRAERERDILSTHTISPSGIKKTL